MPNVAHSLPKASKISTRATTSDLEVFSYALPVNAERLSALSRHFLFLILALMRRGLTGIEAPIDAITRAEYRVNHYQLRSESSTHRALAELQREGLITRHKFRIGPNKFNAVIDFKIEALSFYLNKLRRGLDKHKPFYPTSTHIHPQLSKRPEDKCPNDSYILDKHTNKRTIDKDKPKRHRYHPIVYTMFQILSWSRITKIRDRIENEISGKSENTSGIPWAEWSSKWTQIPIPEREAIARTFLPVLDENYHEVPRPIVRKLLIVDEPPKPTPVRITIDQCLAVGLSRKKAIELCGG